MGLQKGDGVAELGAGRVRASGAVGHRCGGRAPAAEVLDLQVGIAGRFVRGDQVHVVVGAGAGGDAGGEPVAEGQVVVRCRRRLGPGRRSGRGDRQHARSQAGDDQSRDTSGPVLHSSQHAIPRWCVQSPGSPGPRVIDCAACPPNSSDSAPGLAVGWNGMSVSPTEARAGPIEADPVVQPSDPASQDEQVCEVGDRARSPSAIEPPHVLQVP